MSRGHVSASPDGLAMGLEDECGPGGPWWGPGGVDRSLSRPCGAGPTTLPHGGLHTLAWMRGGLTAPRRSTRRPPRTGRSSSGCLGNVLLMTAASFAMATGERGSPGAGAARCCPPCAGQSSIPPCLASRGTGTPGHCHPTGGGAPASPHAPGSAVPMLPRSARSVLLHGARSPGPTCPRGPVSPCHPPGLGSLPAPAALTGGRRPFLGQLHPTCLISTLCPGSATAVGTGLCVTQLGWACHPAWGGSRHSPSGTSGVPRGGSGDPAIMCLWPWQRHANTRCDGMQ